MTSITIRLMLAGIVLALAGCASTGELGALYLLAQPAAPSAAAGDAAGDQPLLIVEEVVLAPYLTSAGIVYQTRPNQIVIADNNRWAAPLGSQLTDGLYDTLDSSLAGMDVRRPGLVAAQPGYRLVTHINRFQGRYDGVATIAGNWQLFNADGDVVGGDRFERNTGLKTDGYPALVRALSRGWRHIKQAMTKAVAEAIAALGRTSQPDPD